jgi:hypothetical protein
MKYALFLLPMLFCATLHADGVETPDAPTSQTTAGDKDKAKPAKPVLRAAKSKDPAAPILADAIAALSTEYKNAQKKDATDDALPKKAIYFSTIPPELTPEKVIEALGKPASSNPLEDAYIRWQLTSALPGSLDALDPKLVGKLLAIYRSAPRPLQRPGSSDRDLKELTRAVRGSKVTDEEFTTQLADAVAARAKENRPVYEFRDTLFARLPMSVDLVAAGLSDAVERFRAADDRAGNDQMRAVDQRMATWVMTLENARQKQAIANMLQQLRRERGVEYATTLKTTGGQRIWATVVSKPSDGQIDQLMQLLKGPAGFQTSDKKKN